MWRAAFLKGPGRNKKHQKIKKEGQLNFQIQLTERQEEEFSLELLLGIRERK